MPFPQKWRSLPQVVEVFVSWCYGTLERSQKIAVNMFKNCIKLKNIQHDLMQKERYNLNNWKSAIELRQCISVEGPRQPLPIHVLQDIGIGMWDINNTIWAFPMCRELVQLILPCELVPSKDQIFDSKLLRFNSAVEVSHWCLLGLNNYPLGWDSLFLCLINI